MKHHTFLKLALIIGGMVGIFVISWLGLWLANGGWPTSGPTGDDLPPNVQKVNPADGAFVAETNGYCVWFLFREGNGMGAKPKNKVNAFLDGVNITSSVEVWTDLISPPTHGRFCYNRGQPGNNLPPGWHTAKLIYTDLSFKIYVYTWRFRVGNE